MEILSVSNKYKNTFENLVDNLDIEYLAIEKQINLLSNDIPGSKDNLSDPKINNNLLDRSKGQQ